MTTEIRIVRRDLLRLGYASVLALAGGAPARAARKDRYVALISIDGFGADSLDDPQISLPNIRRLAAEGARADRMTVVTPSVTWPNHTTLVTGVTPAKHGVLANGVIEPSTGGPPFVVNPRRSKEELTRFPTVFDAAAAAGLTAGEVNWPVTRGAGSLAWSIPDHPDPMRYSTPALLDELKQEGIVAETTDAAYSALGSIVHDEVRVRAAAYLLRRHRPNLLLLHLLLTDSQQHVHGPQTTEARTALSLADRHVGEIAEAIRAAGIRDRTTLIVTADHGFMRTDRVIRPNVRLRNRGLIRPAGDDAPREWDAQVIAEGGVALVYVPLGLTRPELRDRTRQALEGIEGVDRIMTAEEYREIGLPMPNRSPQAPELLLTAQDDYSFSSQTAGPEVERASRASGTHGYVHTNPRMDALFVASGAGIRRGARVDRIRSIDVAPTIARLLDIPLFDVDGRPVEAILSGE